MGKALTLGVLKPCAGGSTSRGGNHTSCASSEYTVAWGLNRLQNCAPLVQHQQARRASGEVYRQPDWPGAQHDRSLPYLAAHPRSARPQEGAGGHGAGAIIWETLQLHGCSQPLLPGTSERVERSPIWCAGICRTPKLVVAKQHISSASLEGPYWWNMNFPPLDSITMVLHLTACCLIACPEQPCIDGSLRNTTKHKVWGSMRMGRAPPQLGRSALLVSMQMAHAMPGSDPRSHCLCRA